MVFKRERPARRGALSSCPGSFRRSAVRADSARLPAGRGARQFCRSVLHRRVFPLRIVPSEAAVLRQFSQTFFRRGRGSGRSLRDFSGGAGPPLFRLQQDAPSAAKMQAGAAAVCQPPSRCFAIFPANRPSLPGFSGNFAGYSASSCRSDFAKCSAGLQACIAFLQGSSVEFAPPLCDVHKIVLAFLAIRSILWVVRTRAPLFHHTSLQAALHERSSLCPFCLLLLHLVSPISPPWSA